MLIWIPNTLSLSQALGNLAEPKCFEAAAGCQALDENPEEERVGEHVKLSSDAIMIILA